MRGALANMRWPVVIAAIAVVLVLGAGFCLFDGAHEGTDDHAMPFDLCLGMLVASVGLPLLGRLVDAGHAPAVVLGAILPVVLPVPAPPPKAASAR